jgi:hypothetical protein
MPPFKYTVQLQALPDCPASDCREDGRDAYRYVFRTRMAHSFTPVLVGQPQRAVKWSDKDRCGGWALSFFSSADVAGAIFTKLQSTSRNIHKAIGDSIALGTLQTGDGVVSKPDDDGHFELHEYAATDLLKRFTVVRELV